MILAKFVFIVAGVVVGGFMVWGLGVAFGMLAAAREPAGSVGESPELAEVRLCHCCGSPVVGWICCFCETPQPPPEPEPITQTVLR